MTLALVDYGAGNLTSVVKALNACGAAVRVVTTADALDGARAIVIPGVGHFGRTASLDSSWRQIIQARISDGTPVLGICLGMQWLFEGSDEAPDVPGLGVFAGRCTRLTGDVKVPHVGWNTLEIGARPSRLLGSVAPGAFAYFSHTYAVTASDVAVAMTSHGHPFTSAVERGVVMGTQFHPEKSDATGLRVIANFLTRAGA